MALYAIMVRLTQDDFDGGVTEMAAQTPEMPLPRAEAGGRRPATTWRRLLAAGIGTVLAGTVANVLIALALASWLQVSAAFTPLRPSSVASLTVTGVAGAAIVFALLTRISADPVRTFGRVAGVALLVSWVAPAAVWAVHAFPGTTGPAVLGLMSLHLVAAAFAVVLLGRYGVS